MKTIKLTQDEIAIIQISASVLKDFDQSLVERGLADDRDILQTEIDSLSLIETILSNPVKYGRT